MYIFVYIYIRAVVEASGVDFSPYFVDFSSAHSLAPVSFSHLSPPKKIQLGSLGSAFFIANFSFFVLQTVSFVYSRGSSDVIIKTFSQSVLSVV